jgi:hypothetical protein
MALPVSVIIPTLNCRSALERHLDAIEAWLPEAAAIIAVDSRSSDGTADLLHERLAPLAATILTTPPGLYASWNTAIAQVKTPWTYISTVGDTIDRSGIAELIAAAQHLNADLVVSPPQMVGEDGISPAETRWPIHPICEALDKNAGPVLLSPLETVIALCSYVTASILGSSASNIYRSSFLQEHPFPVDFGHAGDTAWGLQNCAHLRTAILPTPVSNFCLGWQFKESDPRDQRELFLRLNAEAISALGTAAAEGQADMPFALGWLRGLVANKTVLWDWLAAQAGLVEQHEELRAYLDEVEAEKARSLRSRVKKLIGR